MFLMKKPQPQEVGLVLALFYFRYFYTRATEDWMTEATTDM